MSASQHQNRLISSIVFDPWFLSTRLLTFEHFPLINVEIRCWRMGPRCQPHKRRIVWFLGLFFTRDIAATWLYFWYFSLNIAAGWWVPNVSLTIQETPDILIIFYPWYCIYLTLFSIPFVKQRCWLMGPRGQPLSTRKPAKNTKKNAWTKIRTQDFSLWNMTATVPCHCTNIMIICKCNQLRTNILWPSDPIC